MWSQALQLAKQIEDGELPTVAEEEPPKRRPWRASGLVAASGDDRLHQAGDDVVDVAGDGEAWGDRGRGAQPLDVNG